MRSILVAVALVGCSNKSADSTDTTGDDDSDVPPRAFVAEGRVNNPVSPLQTGRLVVGVVPVADLPNKVLCERFVSRIDMPNVTLPAPYKFNTKVAEGTWAMVAILIDGTGSPQAPAAPYLLEVDATGIRHNGNSLPSPFDMYMQGTMAYECP